MWDDLGIFTGKHCYTGVTTLAPLVDALQCREQIFLINTELSSFLQNAGKNVQKHFAVGISVNVSMGYVIKVIPQFGCIDEITVLFVLSKWVSSDTSEAWKGGFYMGKANAIW